MDNQIKGTNPMFLVWWSVEGTVVPSVEQILIVYKYSDAFLEGLPSLPPHRELEFMIELVLGVHLFFL